MGSQLAALRDLTRHGVGSKIAVAAATMRGYWENSGCWPEEPPAERGARFERERRGSEVR